MARMFGFRGRIGRESYWLRSISIFIVTLLLVRIVYAVAAPDLKIDLYMTPDNQVGFKLDTSFMDLMTILGVVGFYVLSLPVQVQRWHDRGRSGWWSLIVLVPLVGILRVFIQCGWMAGTLGPNKYGEEP